MRDPTAPLKLLVLCTGNSARSILGEAIANRDGQGRIAAWSAGSFPKGQVHPQALALLARLGYPTEGLRSKSWDEFIGEDAPVFDVVITVCDNAAGETCPVWLGHPVRVHWGIPDPAAAAGDETAVARAFEQAYLVLKGRIDRISLLPLETLDPSSLKRALDEIGRNDVAATA
jgi:arsenate reductase (thioredoxin)